MGNSTEVVELLRQNTTLYHYTSALTALEHILPYGRLRFSPLALTNDPYEYKELIPFGGSSEMAQSEERLGFQAMFKIAKLRKENHHVLAFTLNLSNEIPFFNFPLLEKYNELGCCNLRMWSQYGDNYRGVSIAFDQSKLIEKANKLDNIKRLYNDKITYDRFRTVNRGTLQFEKVIKRGVDEYCMDYFDENKNALFFTKDPSFKDENEFRLIVYADTDEKIYLEIKESIIAVIIGDRFPDGLLPSLLYLCRKLQVPCKRAYWESDQIMLYDPKPLDHNFWDEWSDILS